MGSFVNRIRRRASSLSVVMGLLICSGFFWSCQSVSNEPESSEKTYSVKLDAEPAKQPTSIEWRVKGGSQGGASIRSIQGNTVDVEVKMASAPQDSVYLDLWKAGVNYLTLAYTSGMVYVSKSENKAAIALLAELGATPHPDSFAAAYAKALVERDSLFAGAPFPAGAPKGLNTEKVVRLAALEIVGQGKPFAEAVAGAVRAGMDSAALRIEIRILVVSGVVADTSKVFPPPADDVPPLISILEPTNGKVLPYDQPTTRVKVRATDASGIDSVWIGGRLASKSDSLWVIDDIEVPATGMAHKIEVYARDTKGNRSGAVVEVVRLPATVDATPPDVWILEPSAGRVLTHLQSKVLVRIAAKDASGIDSVWIGGRPAAKLDTTWALEVDVPATGADYVIVVLVRDGKANLADTSLTVRRETEPSDPTEPKDEQGPVVRLVSPVSDTIVEHAVERYDVIVSATDPSGVDSVVIGGGTASRNSDGNWHRSVVLDTTGVATSVEIAAFDSLGNVSRQIVRITRKRAPGGVVPEDKTPPVALLLDGLQKNITIDDSVVGKKIGWIVTDDRRLGTVRIDRNVVTGSGGEYSVTLSNWPMGETKVVLDARDSAGNATADTVVVTRVLGASPVLTFSHPEGTHDSVLHVSIASSVSDAVVKYTVDGTDPSSSNGLTYSGGTILIGQSRTLKAMATASGRKPSAILSRVYTLMAAPPVFSVASGTIADSMFAVNLTSATSGVVFHYTTDGSTPVAGVSPSATSSILVDSIRTIKVIASKNGWNSSQVVTGKFLANIPVAVFVGQGGSKVIRADGSLWTTGAAASLADGSLNDRTNFEKVMEGVRAVANGLVLTMQGDVLSYGGRFGSSVADMNPIASGVARISSGSDPSAVFLNTKGELFALGKNDAGQLCTGDSAEVVAPKLVASGVKDAGIACTSARGSAFCQSYHVTTSGIAYGCGRNIGVVQANASLPTQIPGSSYSSVSVYGDFFRGSWVSRSSLLKSTGELMDLVTSASGYKWTSVRTDVQKAVVAGNSLYALESYGWLRHLASGGSPATDWTEVSNQIRDFATDGATTLLIKTDGTLWAMGLNGGRFGDGTTEDAEAMKRVRLPN